MNEFMDEVKRVRANADCLYTQAEVEEAIEQMAQSIANTLADHNPVLLSVMSGATVLAGGLLTRLNFPLQLDYCHASRYGKETVGRQLDWIVSPRTELAGRHVLVVDDILDEGYTLAGVIDYCRQQGAAAVFTAVLVDKQHQRKCEPGLVADFTGLQVEDRYVFGFGMDYKGYWRNAAGIFAVKGT